MLLSSKVRNYCSKMTKERLRQSPFAKDGWRLTYANKTRETQTCWQAVLWISTCNSVILESYKWVSIFSRSLIAKKWIQIHLAPLSSSTYYIASKIIFDILVVVVTSRPLCSLTTSTAGRPPHHCWFTCNGNQSIHHVHHSSSMGCTRWWTNNATSKEWCNIYNC